MEDIRDFFKEQQETFTIYIVEQRFVIGRGLEYFKSFKNTPNFIDTNKQAQKKIHSILSWIQKKIPHTADLIKACFSDINTIGIIDIIVALNKLFSTNEHQAVGPDVIDPIIIQEGEILPKYLAQLIALHKESILQPTIIILLKDNDFERAKKMLSLCPHGINVKMIRNSGESIIYKIINVGADSPEEFLDAFGRQCFSTFSHTRREILVNQEWSGNSSIKKFCPELLKIRTDLLCDNKNNIRLPLNTLISELEKKQGISESDEKLLRSLECISKIFRICCNDSGGQDIMDAYNLAKGLDNEIILAQVYRYSFFMDFVPYAERLLLLDQAYDIFSRNNMEDSAIYCRNNRIIRQFDTDDINVRDFLQLKEKAIYDVPGLVGMSHILNNTGVAHLMTGNPDIAMECFDKGLDYAHRPERMIQKIALLCNKLIAKSYCYYDIDIKELKYVMNLIRDNMGLNKLTFIAARYAMNIISVGFNISPETGQELLHEYNLTPLVQKAFASNRIGSGQLALQMKFLENTYPDYHLLESCQIPTDVFPVTGRRKNFIQKYGYNPFFFSTWL